ncbi:MAG: hypothetical protein U0271_41020 [Polyangiaceae bacterium]
MLSVAGPACTEPAQLRPELSAAANVSLLALSDALEALIADGKDTDEDRQAAFEAALRIPIRSAGDAFGRAAITGRLAEKQGALSLLGEDSPTSLVGEAEKYALISRKLDPDFRQGAAARMLGTLYIFAPANMLEAGNSEDGLELLEGLVTAHPEVVENQLRLAEAYIALNDKEPGRKPLCLALRDRARLRRDEGQLLDKLAKEYPKIDCQAVLGPSQPPNEGPPSTGG